MLGRRMRAAIALPGAVLLAAACTQPAEQADEEDVAWDDLSIATGTTAGVYFPVGGAISEIINVEIEDVRSTSESTGASVENMRLIESGESELALVQGDVAYQAVHGEGEFEGEAIDAQVLMVVYPNVYHAVTLEAVHDDLELDCFADVEGTRFSVGAPGSGNEVATDLVFDGIGLSFDDVDVHRYAYAETATALRDGELDAGSWVVGESHGSLLELEATDPIHLIEMCEDERDAITDEHPFYEPHTIEGGVYETVEEDVETLALWNVLVAPAEFPEDLAEEVVSTIYEHTDTISGVYEPGTPYFTPETLENSPVPLHPGTVNFAEDNGVEIPDELRP
jgi:uncharacterized protein